MRAAGKKQREGERVSSQRASERKESTYIGRTWYDADDDVEFVLSHYETKRIGGSLHRCAVYKEVSKSKDSADFKFEWSKATQVWGWIDRGPAHRPVNNDSSPARMGAEPYDNSKTHKHEKRVQRKNPERDYKALKLPSRFAGVKIFCDGPRCVCNLGNAKILPIVALNKSGKIVAGYCSQIIAAKELGVGRRSIHDLVHGRRKSTILGYDLRFMAPGDFGSSSLSSSSASASSSASSSSSSSSRCRVVRRNGGFGNHPKETKEGTIVQLRETERIRLAVVLNNYKCSGAMVKLSVPSRSMVVHARRNRIVAVLPSAKKRSNETLAEFIDRFRVHFRYHKSSKHEEKEREEPTPILPCQDELKDKPVAGLDETFMRLIVGRRVRKTIKGISGDVLEGVVARALDVDRFLLLWDDNSMDEQVDGPRRLEETVTWLQLNRILVPLRRSRAALKKSPKRKKSARIGGVSSTTTSNHGDNDHENNENSPKRLRKDGFTDEERQHQVEAEQERHTHLKARQQERQLRWLRRQEDVNSNSSDDIRSTGDDNNNSNSANSHSNESKRDSKSTSIPLVGEKWSVEEDTRLIGLVAVHGPAWSILEEHFPGRSRKSLGQRWHKYLDHNNVRSRAWSKEEDRIILSSLEKFGTKWNQIADLLPGRTDNAVKCHFHGTLRRRVEDYLAEKAGISLESNGVRSELPNKLLSAEGFYNFEGDIDGVVQALRNFAKK